jgi:TM2 domain-containing membrane protein YozV
MGEDLPGVRKAARIEITEDELPGAQQSAARPAGASTPPSTGSGLPSKTPAPPGGGAAPASALPPAPAQAKPPALGAYCGACGSPVHPQAMVCPHCGVACAGAAQATGAAVAIALTAKSTAAAVLLSLVFTGAGHWYVGRIGRGFAFFAAAVVCWLLVFVVVGLVLLPIVGIWAAIDASKCAQQHNSQLMGQMGVQMPPTTLQG